MKLIYIDTAYQIIAKSTKSATLLFQVNLNLDSSLAFDDQLFCISFLNHYNRKKTNQIVDSWLSIVQQTHDSHL